MTLFSLQRPRRAAACALIVLIFALTACSGLGGEPRIIATLPPPTPAPTEAGLPTEPPDLALGAQLFARHCTACHGLGGAGDGTLVVAEQIPAPPNFTDSATISDMSPASWYGVVTNGRIENMMPPWREALSERERWAVSLYSYLLPYSAELVGQGEAQIAAVPALAAWVEGQSAEELGALTEGQLLSAIGETAGDLSADAQRAVAAAVRARTVANPEMIGRQVEPPAATEDAVVVDAGSAEAAATAEPDGAAAETTANPFNGEVVGQVSNGTAGGVVPTEGLTATLHIFDMQGGEQVAEVPVAADGSFAIPEVRVTDTLIYAVTVAYRERMFASDVVRGSPDETRLELPVTIYEPTEDPAVLKIDRMVTQIQAVGDGLQVNQAFLFSNDSDRVYTTSQAVGDGRFASVCITLPPGAVVVGFADNPQRYVVSEEEGTVIDTAPVLPNSAYGEGEGHTLQVAYFVPYEGGATIEQPVDYPLDGPVRLLVRPDTVRVTGEQFEALGAETIGSSTYQAYGANLTLQPGEVVRFDLAGEAAVVSTDAQPTASSSLPTLLLIGLIVEIAVIAVLGYWYLRRRQRRAGGDSQPLMDALVRQIAELDNQYEAGKLDEETYRSQRAQLKARLSQLMDEQAAAEAPRGGA